jgi:hypothetical protein
MSPYDHHRWSVKLKMQTHFIMMRYSVRTLEWIFGPTLRPTNIYDDANRAGNLR